MGPIEHGHAPYREDDDDGLERGEEASEEEEIDDKDGFVAHLELDVLAVQIEVRLVEEELGTGPAHVALE